ncbi:RagB/SusD family nutrient uptake outer membrane protein [Persicobacter psychrovividus]|uniref:Membrane protein n=1 Tax=Persicobacter psychrovividus TaxID=387638 RepID=A0ABM7VIP3_9BACT|nr:membrane protein [Persicobacter psychrovividus]
MRTNIFWVLILSTFFSACSQDFLMREPTESINDGDTFERYYSAKAALIGVYDLLSAPTFDGLYLPITNDIIGEDVMVNTVNNWNWFVPIYQLNTLPNHTYVDYPWHQGYRVIHAANMVITNVGNIPDATNDQKAQMEAEARLLRAYAHLQLVQLFAPAYHVDPQAESIMLLDRVLQWSEEPMPRASLSDVYEFLLQDIQVAIDLFDRVEQEDQLQDPAYMSQRAGYALLARVNLNMHRWEEAFDAANMAVEDMELTDGIDLLRGFNFRNAESIFTIAYTPQDNNVYMTIPSFYYPVYGYSSMRANEDFVNMFASSDLRANQFYMEEEIDPDRHLIMKFHHNAVVGNAERIPMRASEMVLIQAEAAAEMGNDRKAQDALFRIQQRADPSAFPPTATGQELIDLILIERRKELFGEGFRMSDIKRRSAPFVRGGNHWVKFDFSQQDDDYYRMTLPIPQSEIDANSNISESNQNQGY